MEKGKKIKVFSLKKVKPKLVSGARQVGKTYIIREYLNNENADFLEINLINQYELIGVLNKSNNVDDLIFNLSVATGYTFTSCCVK